MKCWLFFCIIYVFTHYTDEHLVVLEDVPKGEKSHETQQIDPSSHASASGEGIIEKSEEDAPQELAANEQSSNEHGKQSSESESEKLNGEQNELSEGTSGGSQSDSDDRSDGFDKKSNEAALFILQMPDHSKDNSQEKARKIRNWNRWVSEVSKGNNAEIMGTNPHTYQPDAYFDLGRRFVPQYPYTEKANETTEYAPPGQEIVPIQAPKEVVTVVARESALKVASQPKDKDDVSTKNLLRTGDFWNGVWKEDVSPKSALRTPNNQILGVIRAKIKPGNEFYDLIAGMKKISPRLLYIINEKRNDF